MSYDTQTEDSGVRGPHATGILEEVATQIKVSRRPGWPDIPMNGGGDVDLADYPANYIAENG